MTFNQMEAYILLNGFINGRVRVRWIACIMLFEFIGFYVFRNTCICYILFVHIIMDRRLFIATFLDRGLS